MPELPLYFLGLDFIITDRRSQMRVPVDQPFGAVNQFLVEQVKESSPDGACTHIIQRESSSLPITAGSKLFQLTENSSFILVFPFPDSLDECFPAKIVTRFAFDLFQTFFDAGLGCNSGVIGSGHPKRIETLHSF